MAQEDGSEELYRLQVNLSAEARQLLLQAQDLLRHRDPEIDLGETLRVALRDFVEKRLARKFAVRKSAAAAGKGAEGLGRGDGVEIPSGTPVSVAAAPGNKAVLEIWKPVCPREVASNSAPDPALAPPSRYIPAAVRRAVYQRDGGRSAYVGATGLRCVATTLLELHHLVVPFGKGGAHRVDNLAVLRRAHNGLQAEVDFGRRCMERRRRDLRANKMASERP